MASYKAYALLGLLSIWLCVSFSSAQNDTESTTEQTTDTILVSTEPPAFSLVLQEIESSTSTIKLNWTVPRNYEIKYSRVQSNRIDSDAITSSPELTETEYEVEDLKRETKYNICVTVYNEGTEYDGTQKCDTFATIKLIRDDSLIALFGVIGFLLLCILGGYLCWKYQASKHKKDEDGEEGENAKLNNVHGNPVSIEDNDIPFITPPPDELTPEERKEYEAAARA